MVVQAAHVSAAVDSSEKTSKQNRGKSRQAAADGGKQGGNWISPQLESLPRNELRKAVSFGRCASFFI